MQENTITQFPDPTGFCADAFTDVIRDGARKLIEQAIPTELATLMAAFSKEALEDGRARLVRHDREERRGPKGTADDGLPESAAPSGKCGQS